MRERFKEALCFFVVCMMWATMIIGVMVTCGCSTHRSVVRDVQQKSDTVVRVEYVSKIDSVVKRDSVFVRDSIFVLQKGDSVFTDRWHTVYKDRWRDKVVRDTIVRCDTIVKTAVVTKKEVVTKKQSVWKHVVNGVVVGLLAMAVLGLAGRLLRKIKVI